MDRQNLVPILITILAAVLLAYFITLWTDKTKPKASLTDRQPIFSNALRILVAAEHLSLGRKLQKTDLIWQAWPKEAISKDHIVENTRKLENFIDMVIRKPLTKGEPILDKNVIHPAKRNVLAAIIRPGKRAIALEVNEVTGVSGFIFPGDYIDLIASHTTENNNIVAETIAKNIMVLSVDQTTSRNASDIAKIVKTITIEILPDQAERITKARISGQIHLILQGLIE